VLVEFRSRRCGTSTAITAVGTPSGDARWSGITYSRHVAGRSIDSSARADFDTDSASSNVDGNADHPTADGGAGAQCCAGARAIEYYRNGSTGQRNHHVSRHDYRKHDIVDRDSRSDADNRSEYNRSCDAALGRDGPRADRFGSNRERSLSDGLLASCRRCALLCRDARDVVGSQLL